MSKFDDKLQGMSQTEKVKLKNRLTRQLAKVNASLDGGGGFEGKADTLEGRVEQIKREMGLPLAKGERPKISTHKLTLAPYFFTDTDLAATFGNVYKNGRQQIGGINDPTQILSHIAHELHVSVAKLIQDIEAGELPGFTLFGHDEADYRSLLRNALFWHNEGLKG